MKLFQKKWQSLYSYQHQLDDSYRAEWHHFLDCIKEKKKPLISGEDGMKVIQIIKAARLAAETGCKVNV